MCNIVALSPGVTIPYAKLENMVLNNPHGFGLILKDPKVKRLQIIRKLDEKNGSDPKEIFNLLEENKDIERFLHCRWRTDGPIDIDNTHPFTAFHSDSRQIYFMHNGILGEWKPRSEKITYVQGVRTEEPGENISDSKKYNDEFLAPYLLTANGANGKADITDPMILKVIEKFWGNTDSRGLLICNDLDAQFINAKSWKQLDFGGGKFWSSNDTYFDKLTRGFVFDEQKKKRDAQEAKDRESRFHTSTANSNNRGALTDLKDINLKAREIKTEELSNIFEDYDIWTDEGMASLENLTLVEIEHVVEKAPKEAVNFIVMLTQYFAEKHKKYESLVAHVKTLEKPKTAQVEEI